jgi:hypothetical protein
LACYKWTFSKTADFSKKGLLSFRRERFRIPFGIALPDPGDPLRDIGYLFRSVSPPVEPSPPASRAPHRPGKD